VRLINQRVDDGYREVVLTGTQLGTYGYELPGVSLVDLVRRVLQETEVERLRVSSLQPQEIGQDLLDLWSDRRLCPHFHVPLQSGSPAVLRRMRRRYTPEQYLDAVDAVRRAVADVAVTTDVIVGFPGETEADFHATRSLCEAVGFAAVHVFPYSARPGTSAAHFQDTVDPATRARRLQELVSVARSSAAAFRRRFLGATRPVLWEDRMEASGPAAWTGLTDNYLRVAVRGDGDLANRIISARLTSLDGDVVWAQIEPAGNDRHTMATDRLT
jgi:threonylcarbamoyladenosine tRNA methylthiotransferase MtaB